MTAVLPPRLLAQALGALFQSPFGAGSSVAPPRREAISQGGACKNKPFKRRKE
jgi:hypothetical protein